MRPIEANAAFARALIARGPSTELGPLAADFDWLVGGWDAEVRDFDPDGRVREARGEWWFAWILEGRALQDVWISPRRGDRSGEHPLSAANNRYGTTIRHFDRDAGCWRIRWLNAVSGVTNNLAGRREGDRIVLTGDENGDAIRWSFNDIAAASFIWLSETRQSDGRWRMDAEFRLRRMSAPASEDGSAT